MKKIKNKFIIIVITVLLLIIANFFITNTDDTLESKATLKNWEAIILRDSVSHVLEPKIPFILAQWDHITTQWEESLLIITWWDGSLTRIWENSLLIINDLNVKQDLSSINISFELIAWKTWSNITSFFWDDSYFLQTFNDNEAAVRWTVFDVDLENKFIHVSQHAVDITNKLGETISVWENEAFNIETFSFINLVDFITNYKDKTWENVNKQLDKLHFQDLRNIMAANLATTWEFLQLDTISDKLDNISDIASLTLEEKDNIYNELLNKYQKIHFADASTPDLLGLKLEIKQTMLAFANSDNEDYLINSTLYDIEEVKETNNPYQFEKILDIFSENKDVIERLNISLPDLFDLSEYSNDFKAVIISQVDSIWTLLWEDTLNKIAEFDISELENSLSSSTKDFLDTNFWIININDLSSKFKLTLPSFWN